jgi:uncharacterized protein YceK
MKRARLAIPLVVLLAGCGSVAGTATTSATHSTQLTGTHSAQLTGTQLAAALVPGSAFPRGYRYDSSTSFNSGNRLTCIHRVRASVFGATALRVQEFDKGRGPVGFPADRAGL